MTDDGLGDIADPNDPNWTVEIRGGAHRHDMTGATGTNGFAHRHSHTLDLTATISDAGVSDPAYLARGGNPLNPPDAIKNPIKPLTYVDNLQVYIGKVDETGVVPNPLPDNDNHTKAILTQLKNAQPAIYGSKNKLGEGSGGATDPLANNGTGAIRLDLLSNALSFPEGQYYIELRAPEKDPINDTPIPDNGGRMLYNLYVE